MFGKFASPTTPLMTSSGLEVTPLNRNCYNWPNPEQCSGKFASPTTPLTPVLVLRWHLEIGTVASDLILNDVREIHKSYNAVDDQFWSWGDASKIGAVTTDLTPNTNYDQTCSCRDDRTCWVNSSGKKNFFSSPSRRVVSTLAFTYMCSLVEFCQLRWHHSGFLPAACYNSFKYHVYIFTLF